MPVAHEVMENCVLGETPACDWDVILTSCQKTDLSVLDSTRTVSIVSRDVFVFQFDFQRFSVFVLQTATDSSSNSSQKKEQTTQLVATSTFYEPHPHRCILQYRPPERYSLDQVNKYQNRVHKCIYI